MSLRLFRRVAPPFAAAALSIACSPKDRTFNDASSSGEGGASSSSTHATVHGSSSSGTHPASSGSGGGDGGGGGATDTFHLTLERSSALLHAGESTDVSVTVSRDNPAFGTITISATDLPAGVTATPIDIPGNMTTGTLTLQAAGSLTEGELAPATVMGTSNGVSHTAALALAVGGAPGALDTGFATQGRFVTSVGQGNSIGRGLFIAADGKILVTGQSGLGQALTLRLRDDGSRDSSFGTSGVVSTAATGAAGGIVVASGIDGRVVVGGFGGPDAIPQLTLFGYDDTGTLDPTFGAAVGTTTLVYDATVSSEARALMVKGNQLFFAGQAATATPTDILGVSNLQGKNGNLLPPGVGDTVRAAAIDGAGLCVFIEGFSGDFQVTRLHLDGTIDPNFGGGSGVVTTDFVGRTDTASGVVFTSGGKILVAGITDLATGTDPHVALAQYKDDGSPDGAFGAGGSRITNTLMDTQANNSAVADSQGRILFGGYTTGASPRPAVARFLPDGNADTTFGNMGVVALDFMLGQNGPATGVYGIGVDAFDRVVVSGTAGSANGSSVVVARVWP